MSLAPGNFEKLAHKHEKFDVYELMGDWIVDTDGKRGWIVQVLDGLDTGNFVVQDGKIHVTSLHSGTQMGTAVVTGQREADIGPSLRRVILDAVGKWQAEELKNPRV